MNNTMKLSLSLLVLLVATSLVSMAAKPKGSDSIWVETKEATFKKGVIDISLNFPQLDSKRGDETIVKNINQAVFKTLSANPPIPYNGTVTSMDGLHLFITTMATELDKKGRATTIDPLPFQYFSSWSAFGNKVAFSIFIKSYMYTGGAHGSTQGTYLNFDATTGQQINLHSFIEDTAKLLDLAAIYFCKERHLPLDALQLQTGLFCELSSLKMPSELGFSHKGLVLYYNQYEIAPYSMGAIVITIPYKAIQEVIGDKLDGGKVINGGMRNFDNNTKRVNMGLWRK